MMVPKSARDHSIKSDVVKKRYERVQTKYVSMISNATFTTDVKGGPRPRTLCFGLLGTVYLKNYRSYFYQTRRHHRAKPVGSLYKKIFKL